MKVFHGSSMEIKIPDLKHSRRDIDFGVGFYTTESEEMAKRWASNKQIAIINEYTLNMDTLNVCELELNKEWLEYVSYNRGYSEEAFDDSDFDVVIGATADDRLFSTLERYLAREITDEQAIRYLNVAQFNKQIVIKTQKALDCLNFERSLTLSPSQKEMYYQLSKLERRNSMNLLKAYQELEKPLTIGKKQIQQKRKLKGVNKDEQGDK